MMGRAAYHDPGLLGEVDARLFDPAAPRVTPFEAVDRYLPHMRAELARGIRLPALVRPMIGLFQGRPGARAWRRILTVDSLAAGAGEAVIARAMSAVSDAAERQRLATAA